MHRVQRFHTLHLNQHVARDNEIRPMLAYEMPLVGHRHTDLPCVRKASLVEFNAECFLVGRFEQAWTEVTVYLNCASNDLVSQWIVFVHKNLGASVARDQRSRAQSHATSAVTRSQVSHAQS